VIYAMNKCSQPEMTRAVQETLNNIKKAQQMYHPDLWQATAKYPRKCGEDSPFGGTGMNSKAASTRESSGAHSGSGRCNKSYMKHPK
jgi:hypothetical protein